MPGVLFFLFVFAFLVSGCSKKAEIPEAGEPETEREAFIGDFWQYAFGEAGLPRHLADKVALAAEEGPDFVMELLAIMEQDPFLYVLVDKEHALPASYVPADLKSLSNGVYKVTRDGLTLREAAAAGLEEMALAARVEGVNFTVGSAYRSYDYQVEVYNRVVQEMGEEAADRESARPGYSQHQTGLALDFYPIDDSFAKTVASGWLKKNAARFGWSISFPDGYEAVTGYRWESWHYRYVGKDLALFIDKYFDGIQQYALQFIHAWAGSSL
jgi:D-alanyl-D-alanine carboxypeptidase